MTATKEIWILGANGRCGRAVAAELAARQHALVLVGRDAGRLRDAANAIGGSARVVVADSIADIAERIARSDAVVVVNTIGPFTRTALPIARACPRGCHYVDISNELYSVIDLLGLHDEAARHRPVSRHRRRVRLARDRERGAEAVRRLGRRRRACESTRCRSSTARVPLGETLAATIVEGLPMGGRRYENGALVRAQLGADPERLALPDGSTMVTAAMPTGDLEAARRASGASSAVAASSMAPSTPLARFAMSAVAPLFGLRVLRDFAQRRLARVHIEPPAQKRDSWGHARVQWSDGRVREGWLRAGEAMAFTNAVTTAVTLRLAGDEGRPGAYTPGALFGPDLAVQAGGQFIVSAEA